MAGGILTKNERIALELHPFVEKVTKNRIYYTEGFKRKFVRADLEGKKIGDIFKEAGFDVKILGPKRIERAAARWRERYGEVKLER